MKSSREEIFAEVKEIFPLMWKRVMQKPKDKQIQELQSELSSLSCECDHAEGYICEACILLADLEAYKEWKGDSL